MVNYWYRFINIRFVWGFLPRKERGKLNRRILFYRNLDLSFPGTTIWTQRFILPDPHGQNLLDIYLSDKLSTQVIDEKISLFFGLPFSFFEFIIYVINHLFHTRWISSMIVWEMIIDCHLMKFVQYNVQFLGEYLRMKCFPIVYQLGDSNEL